MKKHKHQKIERSKFSLRKSNKYKTLGFFVFIMPVFIISVLVFGVVVPLHRCSSEESIEVFSKKNCDYYSYEELKKLLVLVNSSTPLPQSYRIDIETFNGVQCDKIMVSDLRKMIDDAKEQSINLCLTKGYVSPEEQKKIYEDEINGVMSKGNISLPKARLYVGKYVNVPGKDEHQTALAVNIMDTSKSESFELTKEYSWLQKNAANYGFILRYPDESSKKSHTKKDFDPTLYRYVGVTNAQKMRIMNMCLEEYVDYINER